MQSQTSRAVSARLASMRVIRQALVKPGCRPPLFRSTSSSNSSLRTSSPNRLARPAMVCLMVPIRRITSARCCNSWRNSWCAWRTTCSTCPVPLFAIVLTSTILCSDCILPPFMPRPGGTLCLLIHTKEPVQVFPETALWTRPSRPESAGLDARVGDWLTIERGGGIELLTLPPESGTCEARSLPKRNSFQNGNQSRSHWLSSGSQNSAIPETFRCEKEQPNIPRVQCSQTRYIAFARVAGRKPAGGFFSHPGDFGAQPDLPGGRSRPGKLD